MLRCWAALALCLIAGPALAAATGQARLIDPALLPDAAALLPPPPAPGSDAQLLDGAIFLRTRGVRQHDPAEWARLRQQTLAAPPAMLQSFGCALGVAVNASTTPSLIGLWRQMVPVVQHQVARAQSHYRRRRPFLHVHQPICVPRFTRLDRSPSYPSSHAALAWSLALILTEAAPSRADATLAHGRDLGDSRVACGVNWQSDITAGQLDAAGLVAVLHSSAAFRTELARSRAEIAVSGRAACPLSGGSVCNCRPAP